MHASFLQKVVLTLIVAFFASCLIEFYKDVIQRADNDLNGAYRHAATPTPHP